MKHLLILLSLLLVLSSYAKEEKRIGQERSDYDVEFGKMDTLNVVRTYLSCIELSPGPRIRDRQNHTSGRYRLSIVVEEIYYYPLAEYLEYSGGEGSHIALKYSVTLQRKMFTGKHQPGNEGVEVYIGNWSTPTECYLDVNNETYRVKFDPDPNKIKVELVVKKEKDK